MSGKKKKYSTMPTIGFHARISVSGATLSPTLNTGLNPLANSFPYHIHIYFSIRGYLVAKVFDRKRQFAAGFYSRNAEILCFFRKIFLRNFSLCSSRRIRNLHSYWKGKVRGNKNPQHDFSGTIP